jgi:hypothetical protein
VAAVSVVVVAVLSVGAAANGADAGGRSTGNGGNAPASSGSARAAADSSTVSLVPAFDNDLPKGSAHFGPSTKGTSSQATPSAAAAPSWICTVYASDPRRAVHSSKNSVEGEGWQSCTGSQTVWYSAIKVTIQWYAGLGIWNNKYSWSSGYQDEAWLERVIWYYCGGTGTHTYRIVTDGWQGTYHQAVQSLNYLRTTC